MQKKTWAKAAILLYIFENTNRRWKFGWFCQELCYGIYCKFHSGKKKFIYLYTRLYISFAGIQIAFIHETRTSTAKNIPDAFTFSFKISKKSPNLVAPQVLNWPSFLGRSKGVFYFAYSTFLMLNNSRRETWSRFPESVIHKVMVVHITLSSENCKSNFAMRESFRR